MKDPQYTIIDGGPDLLINGVTSKGMKISKGADSDSYAIGWTWATSDAGTTKYLTFKNIEIAGPGKTNGLYRDW